MVPHEESSPESGPSQGQRLEEAEAPDRKERILDVAERLFRHYGPAKTTVADIARACGIGVGTVYLDFASKEAIVEALAAQRTDEIVEHMRAAAREVSDPRERIARMLEARTQAFLDLRERGVHACDLVRCADSMLSGRRARAAQAPAPTTTAPSRGAGVFGERARGVLRAEMVAVGRRVSASAQPDAVEVDAALDAIELAFAALSPPFVAALERERALALSRALARLLVYGV